MSDKTNNEANGIRKNRTKNPLSVLTVVVSVLFTGVFAAQVDARKVTNG